MLLLNISEMLPKIHTSFSNLKQFMLKLFNSVLDISSLKFAVLLYLCKLYGSLKSEDMFKRYLTF